MCDIKLLKKAFAVYDMARLSFTHKPNDEETLESCWYMLQQSVELTLKGFLEFTSAEVPKKHSIRVLINETDNKRSGCYVSEWIRRNQNAITDWEVEGRYGKNMATNFVDTSINLFYVREFLISNGIWDKPLPIVNSNARSLLRKSIPLTHEDYTDLEWNILYAIFHNVAKLPPHVVVNFQMEDYYSIRGIRDTRAELQRLKLMYNTENLDYIKVKAFHMYETIKAVIQ